MIVRDEAHQLSECVSSIAAVADEIVVHDTGSKDNTVALARRLGARVSVGTFDGDFAAARNAALARCSGEWILWIDADERLVIDEPARLRAVLKATSTTLDGLIVPIDNLRGTETAPVQTHAAVRLFRRQACRWEGHLHEQVLRRNGTPPSLGRCEAARLLHRGYLVAAMNARQKSARNVASARAELVAGGGAEYAATLCSLGRSYMLAGDLDACVDLCRDAAVLGSAPTRRLALRAVGEALLAADRTAELPALVEELRSAGAPELADVFAVRTHLATGEFEGALADAAHIREAVDADGFEYGPHLVAHEVARALLEVGRPDEAADALLASLRTRGGLDGHLGLLVEALEAAGRDPGDVYDTLGAARVRAFVPPLLQLEPASADRVLEAWFARDGENLSVLAGAAQVATRLPVDRQLVWSARLRAAGLETACPVIAASARSETPPRDRALGAAAAHRLFGDQRARLAFVAAALSLEPEGAAALRAELAVLAPGFVSILDATAAARLVEPPDALDPPLRHILVVAGQSRSLRALALARALRTAGNAVALAEPAPAESATPLRGECGFAVRTWSPAVPLARAVEGAVASEAARGRLDAVLLAAGAPDLGATLRDVAPGVAIVDDSRGAPLSVSADAFAFRAPLPRALRCGLLIVVASSSPDGRRRAAVEELVASAAGTPIALVDASSDPEILSGAPGALSLTLDADVLPFVAAVEGIVLLGEPEHAEEREWCALAAAAGTPIVVVRSDGDGANVRARVVELLGGDLSPEAPPASQLDELLVGLDSARPAASNRTHDAARNARVLMTGSCAGLDGVAQVNRELVRHLAHVEPSVALDLADGGDVESEASAASVDQAGIAVELRHEWPPDFTAPSTGRLVCIQPFAYGGFPAEWVAPLRDVVDELWVPSRAVHAAAIESGIPEHKVKVVPFGVDVGRFHPDGPRRPSRRASGTRFLFVGDCSAPKGFDVLLETYLATFRAGDDVCLVVKPHGGVDAEGDQRFDAELRAAAGAPGAPAIELIDGDLTGEDMAALYRSCDALVYPYRAESFGLVVAEALASGRPAIVTGGGACDDFCDDEDAYVLPARRVAAWPGGYTPPEVGGWWLEPSRAALSEAMRAVVADPAAARRRGENGRRRIVGSWTWLHAAQCAAQRLAALTRPTPADRVPPG